MRAALAILAIIGAFVLLSRSAPATTNGIDVNQGGDGIIVTVSAQAANVHFTYQDSCDDGKPCYAIDAGQGMVGVPATSSGCKVHPGKDTTPTNIQCPIGAPSITFKMIAGGTWSAYQGGGGLHTGGSCSPARVIVAGGNGGPVSINSWDGCHEVVQCGTSGFTAVEADATDDISGKCLSIIKH